MRALIRRDRLSLVAIFATAVALTGCGSNGDAGPRAGAETRTVSTAYGDVEVPTAPRRVVAVSYGGPWQLKSLGVDVVGSLDYSATKESLEDDIVKYLDGVKPVDQFLERPNLETIATLKPDLIIGIDYETDEQTAKALSDIAPTAIFPGQDRSNWAVVMDGLAEATGTQDKLAESADRYESRVAQLKKKYAPTLTELTFAPISRGGDEGNFALLYPNNAAGRIWADLGLKWPSTYPTTNKAGFEDFSFEFISEKLGAADVIFAPTNADGSPLPVMQPLYDTSAFQQLPAVQAGRFFKFPVADVNSYDTASAYLDNFEQYVLAPLAE